MAGTSGLVGRETDVDLQRQADQVLEQAAVQHQAAHAFAAAAQHTTQQILDVVPPVRSERDEGP